MLQHGTFPFYHFTPVIATVTCLHLNITVRENLGNQHILCCLRDSVLNPQVLLQAQFAKSLLSSAQAALVHLEHLLHDTQWVLSLALVDGQWRRQKGLKACCQECISRESSCNGGPDWIIGNEHYSFVFGFFLM